ncbi:Protein kinase, membrane associated tyrosine threonine 1 [Clydaea vesicula]|uniref:Protein kinase, membrane associated tyrosine threonine 1 n=1 Tax=Clydaea vesicula TaxID=447962 RepID=A0AAD5Y1G5_9FUNG|nr:Protein kinase, membrane associated tyrosine threonine 1 [Clydaea vesicula]
MNDGFKIPLTPFSGPTPKLNNSNQIFSTPNSAPQPSKFKPLPQAFHSTGFLKKSKKNESRNLVMPDTPLKRKYQDQTCLILLETNNKKKGLSINQKQLHQLQLDEKKFNLMSSELRILNKDYFKNASVNSNGYHQNSNSQVDLNFNNPNNFYVNSVDLFDEKFILLEKLGSGSFAEVFKVVEKGTNVEYAIKKTKKVYQAHRDRMLKLEEVELMWEDFGMASRIPVPRGIEHEGDRTYMAPEILENTYTKKADVFSLGLIIFEIALQIVLPENGQNWHILREGKFDEFDFGNLSLELVQLIKLMLEPNYEKRCCIDEVLTMAKRRASFYGGF